MLLTPNANDRTSAITNRFREEYFRQTIFITQAWIHNPTEDHCRPH
jgi:hypothetical protein